MLLPNFDWKVLDFAYEIGRLILGFLDFLFDIILVHIEWIEYIWQILWACNIKHVRHSIRLKKIGIIYSVLVSYQNIICNPDCFSIFQWRVIDDVLVEISTALISLYFLVMSFANILLLGAIKFYDLIQFY